jgi:hypothetical protein
MTFGLLASLGAPSASAAGHTYFVAPTGSDTVTCAANSQAAPFLTIQKALSCAVNGDTISLASTSGKAPYPGIGTVSKNVTITAGTGADARSVTVDVSPTPTPMTVAAGSIVTVAGVSLVCEAGLITPTPQACGPDVTNNGTLTLQGDAVTGAFTFSGIANASTGSAMAKLSVVNSTISHNTFATDGGGIHSFPAAMATADPSVTVDNSTITGNSAFDAGGGLAVQGLSSTTTLVNSTVAGNASLGGAGGGGIYDNGAATVKVSNTIIAANTSTGNLGPDCVSSLADGPGGHNLLGNNTNCSGLTNLTNGDQVGTGATPINPNLGTLANNGGPTDTLALQAGSPAIGAADTATCQAAPIANLDQRGDPRHADTRGVCDVGAYDTGLRGPYHPLTPARITDTRTNSGFPNAGKTLGPGNTLAVQVTAVGGVPKTGATAVVLNVTATNTSKQSFLTVWPTGATQPTASNLNWVAGQTVPNLAEVGLGTGGQVSVFNPAGSVDVVVDVEGYVGPSTTAGTGLFNPLTPARITDTRTNSGFPNAGKTLGPGNTLDVQVTNIGGVPNTGVAAAVLNVTATNPTKQGFLTVWPKGAMQPTASNLNFAPGQTVPNRVMVPVGTGGQVSIFNAAGSVDVVVDVGGYFTDSSNPMATGAQFTPTTPARITDTRPNSGFANAGKTLAPSGTLDVQVRGAGGVPATGVTAAVLNVTVTNTTKSSFLTVWPTGATRPTASDLNWVGGQTVPNLVVVKLGTDGAVQIFNAAGSVDVVVDVSGWYS